jgi:hypothetical protein
VAGLGASEEVDWVPGATDDVGLRRREAGVGCLVLRGNASRVGAVPRYACHYASSPVFLAKTANLDVVGTYLLPSPGFRVSIRPLHDIVASPKICCEDSADLPDAPAR